MLVGILIGAILMIIIDGVIEKYVFFTIYEISLDIIELVCKRTVWLFSPIIHFRIALWLIFSVGLNPWNLSIGKLNESLSDDQFDKWLTFLSGEQKDTWIRLRNNYKIKTEKEN